MCTYTRKFDQPTFTGCKSVIKIKDRFYSPCTLIEYKPGPVLKEDVIENEILYTNVINKGCKWHNPEHTGRTSVFRYLLHAQDELEKNTTNLGEVETADIAEKLKCEPTDIEFCIIRMTIGSTPELPEMYYGLSSDKSTISGSNIISIEELK
mgnify:CR=1 FL=1